MQLSTEKNRRINDHKISNVGNRGIAYEKTRLIKDAIKQLELFTENLVMKALKVKEQFSQHSL
mgnify:CR=1 FL=1